MPISAIRFQNFKVFRKATLRLGRTTLLVGPNGSGKSTALQAIKFLATAALPQNLFGATNPPRSSTRRNPALRRNGVRATQDDALRSIGAPRSEDTRLDIEWDMGHSSGLIWKPKTANPPFQQVGDTARLGSLLSARIFAFEHDKIAAAIPLTPSPEIEESGQGIPGVLTNLQDHHPDRFDALNKDLGSWIPEFDRVLLDTPEAGKRSFMLRTREGSHQIPAQDLSQGTLFALALLTISHLPDPPILVAIEDPDRGMHPRLLRDVLDATERLANPQAFGDQRSPVQIVLTTHSPLLVDLFRDRPEDVVLIDKKGLWSEFRRLSEIPNIDEILNDAHLGDAWFSGSLGGVPAKT
jgi:predicted ATPase